MAVTLWDHIDQALDGQLRPMLVEWHGKQGIGTPTIARMLNEMGFQVEQRTVWRWLRAQNISNQSNQQGGRP